MEDCVVNTMINNEFIMAVFSDLSLFDSVLLYRRAILGESYEMLGNRLGYSHENIRNRYFKIIKTIRKRLEDAK